MTIESILHSSVEKSLLVLQAADVLMNKLMDISPYDILRLILTHTDIIKVLPAVIRLNFEKIVKLDT